jgi:hypothetical protein
MMHNYLKLVYPNSEMLIDVSDCTAKKIQKLHRFYKVLNPKVISYILSSSIPLECAFSENKFYSKLATV